MIFLCIFIVAVIHFGDWKIRYMLSLTFVVSICNWVDYKFCLSDYFNFMAFTHVLKYIPYFLSGIIVSKTGLFEIFQGMFTVKLTSLFLLAITILFVYHIRGGFPFSNAYMWLVVVLFFCCLYVYAGKLLESGITPPVLLDALDKSSMGIYLIHHILIMIFLIYVPGILKQMNTHPYISPCILFLCVFFMSFALTTLLNRLGPTALLLGNTTKKYS